MKVATEVEIDRSAPLTTVDGEEGPLWRVTGPCKSCRTELHLDTKEKPNHLARALAAGLAPRIMGGIVCAECADLHEAEEERRQAAALKRERMNASNLPEALQGFRFDEMERTERPRIAAIEAARSWASESDSKGLCFFGGVGVGKTRLAATAASQRLSRHSLTWVSMPVLLAQLGAAFNDSARREAISVLAGKGALVIDDLDKVNPSEWARNQLFAAIDKRVQAGSPLLITTNLRPAELGDKFGEPVMSRIAGYCEVFEMPGQDMRLKFNYDGSEGA